MTLRSLANMTSSFSEHAMKVADEISSLQAHITELQAIGSALVTSRQTMRENIAKHLAARGRNDLATEVRAMRFENPPEDFGILLPGWTCAACGAFTGEAKGPVAECRGCGKAR